MRFKLVSTNVCSRANKVTWATQYHLCSPSLPRSLPAALRWRSVPPLPRPSDACRTGPPSTRSVQSLGVWSFLDSIRTIRTLKHESKPRMERFWILGVRFGTLIFAYQWGMVFLLFHVMKHEFLIMAYRSLCGDWQRWNKNLEKKPPEVAWKC